MKGPKPQVAVTEHVVKICSDFLSFWREEDAEGSQLFRPT